MRGRRNGRPRTTALRIRRGWRQADLAAAVRVSQSLVSRVERGHLETLSIRTVRGMFAALDAGCSISPWWRSGELDRLLDESHASLVASAVALLERHGWKVAVETSYAIYGERGSIDVLGTRSPERAAVVVEVKSRLVSVEEMLRTLDRKVRLAPGIAEQREGWRPRGVSRMVVFGDGTTNRRRVSRLPVLNTALPVRGDALTKWLAEPTGLLAALVFQSPRTGGTVRRGIAGGQRTRRASPRTNRSTAGPRNSESGAEKSTQF